MSAPTLHDRFKAIATTALGSYHPGFEIRNGKGSYLYDSQGRRYLDFTSGIGVTSTGHCHPRVVKSIKDQADKLLHACIGIGIYEPYVAVAEKVLTLLPKELTRVFFCQSGSEAVEAALKCAKYVSGKQNIVAFTGGFHGRTLAALSVTSSKEKYRDGYQGWLLEDVDYFPFPYCYRCPFQKKEICDQVDNIACLIDLEHFFNSITDQNNIAAVIIEPVAGEGGYLPAPKLFLKKLRKLCDRFGIILIFDEVQTGIGRMGKFTASEWFGVTPDLLVLAKGIASGMPLGAVIGREQFMTAWKPGSHGSTFGGNPVSTAAALATIETILAEHLMKNAVQMGLLLKEGLRELAKSRPQIGDIRGEALMIGLEIIDPTTGKSDPVRTKEILTKSRELGLILISCGLDDQVIRLIPPLTVNAREIAEGLAILAKSMG